MCVFVCVCRLQFEKQFSDQIVELKREREEEIRKLNQQWEKEKKRSES